MRFPAPVALPLLAAGLAAAAGGARAASLNVPLNHSVRLPVAGRAASVVVGNAKVADVTVVDSRTLFVTGKSAGSTDVMVVDPLGRTVFAGDISVIAGAGRQVTVHRGGERADLACDPRCLAPERAGTGAAPAPFAGAGPSPAAPAMAAAALGAGPVGALAASPAMPAALGGPVVPVTPQ